MIYSSVQMRWAEVQFYKFCEDVYQVNHDMLDLVYIIETVCRLGKLNSKPIKNIAGQFMGDPYYSPSKIEIICLARLLNFGFSDIAKMLKVSRQAIHQMTERQKENYYPTPKLQVYEDQKLIEFLNSLKIYQKVGLSI